MRRSADSGSRDDVIAYLLAHGRRDMTALLATLAALDRYSLAPSGPLPCLCSGSGCSGSLRCRLTDE
jgi:hypothetical protein